MSTPLSLPLGIHNTNLWSLPNFHLTREEKDEDDHLSNILPGLASPSSINTLTKFPQYRLYFPTSVIMESGEMCSNQIDVSESCNKVIVSLKTERILFLGQNGAPVYQSRVMTLESFQVYNPLGPYHVLTIQANRYMHRTHTVHISFESSAQQQNLETTLSEIISRPNRSRGVIPETFFFNPPTESSQQSVQAITNFSLLWGLQQLFTDVVYGPAVELFSIIKSNYNHRAIAEKFRVTLAWKGLPRIVVADHGSNNDETRLSKLLDDIDTMLQSTGLTAVDGVKDFHYVDPDTHLRDGQEGSGCRGALFGHYTAHFQQDNRTVNSIHLSLRLIELFVASEVCAAQSPTSVASWLTMQAMVRIVVVHELAHFFVHCHGSVQVPETGKDHKWITREMFVKGDDGKSKLDSGFMVEVMWLGHHAELVFDEHDELRLFIPVSLDRPAFQADSAAQQRANAKLNASIDKDEESFVDGQIVEDNVVKLLLGPNLPLGRSNSGGIFTNLTSPVQSVRFRQGFRTTHKRASSPPRSTSPLPPLGHNGIFAARPGAKIVEARGLGLYRRSDVFHRVKRNDEE
ncbi:hypothetical protein E1B28_003069 [Marasmius oreades]|uniref:Uncharacterized protein n=1 Tax=Marasmius oreades TaxID=181124 RepID=A0A9P7RLT9_9AGAR|nr:uncharacterized protein E1B28_003069 [Marasmius oreades]KAG7085508.1 hypothetical protein E1B28_003069 [Marasmius oreades]